MLRLLILFLIILFVGIILKYKKNPKLLWLALGTVSTLMVVIIAVLPIYEKWVNRPKLEIRMPAYSDNFIRWGNEYASDRMYYCVDIELRNIGSSIAKDCQPFLTAIGKKENNEWKKTQNWAPIGLQWLLARNEQQADPYPEMRDLAPQRPYIFKLGYIFERLPDSFALARHITPTGQPETFGPGEHCFEIKVYSSNADPVIKYFKVSWESGITEDNKGNNSSILSNVKNSLEVKILKHAPWE